MQQIDWDLYWATDKSPGGPTIRMVDVPGPEQVGTGDVAEDTSSAIYVARLLAFLLLAGLLVYFYMAIG